MNDLTNFLPILLALVVAVAIIVVSSVIARRRLQAGREEARRAAGRTRRNAQAEAKEITLQAEERALAASEEADRREEALDQRDGELDQRHKELDQRESDIRRLADGAERERRQLESDRERLAGEREEVAAARARTTADLQRIAGLSAEEARAELIASIEEDARRRAARSVRRILDDARENAEREAMNLVVQASQRIQIKQAVETTVSFIRLPNDEMKGRIIGREGRNIRALETATGIDLVVDDTPGSILISSFDPVRREIARVSIERLIEDGRIHPARIEEVVEKVRDEVAAMQEEAGAQAAYDLGITDLHPRLQHLVGGMKYRTQHGQNLLQHCLEVAWIAGYMAIEVGARADVVRRAGLLHEIGWVADAASQDTLTASAELAAKHGEDDEVAQTILSLHRDANAGTPEAVLIQVAERASTHRPGARKDNLQVYIERLKRLEEIARTFDGVQQAFAVKAGKELRVLVAAEHIGDNETQRLSRRIAHMVEDELSFPGKIKVSVVRQTRMVHYAL